MSSCQDKTSLSCSGSRENVSSGEWERMNDACTSSFDEPTGDEIHGGMDAVQLGIDGHLSLPRVQHELAQDGMILGLVEQGYAGYHGRLVADSESDYLDIHCDPNYSESDVNVTTKKRNRSNSSRHRGDVVTELGPEEVRWFFKEDKRTWKPFVGHDSLKIEMTYRKFCELNPTKVNQRYACEEAEDLFESTSGCEAPEFMRQTAAMAAQPVPENLDAGCKTDETDLDSDSIVEAVCVRGGLYEVDIKEKDCYPVYWNQQDHIPVMRGQWFTDGSWLPLEQEDSDLIELEHLARFRGQQMKDTFNTEVVTTTVDSKDGHEQSRIFRCRQGWDRKSRFF